MDIQTTINSEIMALHRARNGFERAAIHANILRLHAQKKAESSENKSLGDVWKKGNQWLTKLPNGVQHSLTKKRALAISRIILEENRQQLEFLNICSVLKDLGKQIDVAHSEEDFSAEGALEDAAIRLRNRKAELEKTLYYKQDWLAAVNRQHGLELENKAGCL